jgi:hypothetical protein
VPDTCLERFSGNGHFAFIVQSTAVYRGDADNAELRRAVASARDFAVIIKIYFELTAR